MSQYSQNVAQKIRQHLISDGLLHDVSDCEVKIVLLGTIFRKLAYDIAQRRGIKDWRDTFFIKKYLPRHKVDAKKIAGIIGKYITQYGDHSTQSLYSKFQTLSCDKKLTFDEVSYLFYKGMYMSHYFTPDNTNGSTANSSNGNILDERLRRTGFIRRDNK
jgi:hypothetical protein